MISGRQDNRRRQEKRTVVPVLLTGTFPGAYYFPGANGGPQRGTFQHERRREQSFFVPRARVTTGASPRADHQERVMFRTIVISVLAVSASAIASGGMAERAGWGRYYGLNWGGTSNRQSAFIGVFGGDFLSAYSVSTAGPGAAIMDGVRVHSRGAGLRSHAISSHGLLPVLDTCASSCRLPDPDPGKYRPPSLSSNTRSMRKMPVQPHRTTRTEVPGIAATITSRSGRAAGATVP